MKTRNVLITLGLAAMVLSCKNEEKTQNKFRIESSQLKQTYDLNEKIQLKLAEEGTSTLDSVVYFANGKRVGAVKANAAFEFVLAGQNYGNLEIVAKAYEKGKEDESSIQLNLFPSEAPVAWNYTVVNTYPHDQKAYTQGLEFYGDVLIESTGNGEGVGTGTKGKSSIRKVNPKTGEVLKIVELPDEVFGEGATVLGGKLYQLTYKNNHAFRYDINTFEQEKVFPYFQNMEGWGLTNDGTNLYMSDGTPNVYRVNPEDFSKVGQFTVATNQQLIPAVNEMEWVNGKIYANVYGMEAICVIDPNTGKIEAVIDLSQLKSQVTKHPDLDVLNGIAYNKKNNTFFVTGKNWDKMFEIKISN